MFVTIRIAGRWVACMVAVAVLMAGALVGSARGAAAQDADLGILLRAWTCPDGVPSDEWEECESIVGATYRVEADGTEIASSPVTTVADTGIGHGVLIEVPQDATTITVTQLSGAPDGYVPAPGFDPFSADIADLPQVGFGGESTGPGIAFINIPAEDGDDDTGDDGGTTDGDTGQDDAEETTTLPSTGTGAAEAQRSGAVAGLLAAALALAGAGGAMRRASAGRR